MAKTRRCSKRIVASPSGKSKLKLSKTLHKKIVKKSTKPTLGIIAIVERIGKINKKGFSNFISISPQDLKKNGCKPQEIALFKSNNGVSYLRRDAPLSRRYHIERKYHKTNGALLGFKLIGFNHNLYFSRSIPQEVRKATLEHYGHKCIWCGSTNRLEVDHKNGRYSSISNRVEDFQILCKSCNDKKRERCKRCQVTGQRFNVQSTISNVLYKVPFTCGSEKFNDKVGCKGCFLYDIEDFYAKHDCKTGKIGKIGKAIKTKKDDVTTEHEVKVIVRRVSKGPSKKESVIYTKTIVVSDIEKSHDVSKIYRF
jgi:hypothetical protein